MTKTVWIVRVWDYGYDFVPHSYILKVCATKELAEKAASEHPRWTYIEEYDIEEE